ncbi:poly-gamma-glutamate hydrolase family protein [Mesorhizobium atlanticum]
MHEADFQTQKDNHPFPGIQDSNIVNRGLTGKGAQLEVPFSLRRRLGNELDLLERFCGAVRKAIDTFDARNGARSPIMF